MKKILSALSIAALMLSPNLVLAQEEAALPPPAADAPAAPASEAPAQDTSSVQEATTSQETIPSADLEPTNNPQNPDALEQAIKTIDDATDEAQADASSTDVVDTLQATTTAVEALPPQILEPSKEFTFDVSGRAIAADASPDWSAPLEKADEPAEEVTDAPELDTGEPHTLTVSGECSDPFFVILIYANEKDYSTNPSSYVFNRAFRCEDDRYSYDVKDLPFSTESGTYYLLVAGQGDKGPWKPITALIPIGVTVKTIIHASTSTQDESAQ